MAIDKQGKVRAVPKPEGKKRGGTSPRRSGDRVERMVAKDLGARRTPGSGAFKNTNKNLEGDIDVEDVDGKPFLKLEVKACGTINTRGEKSFALSKNVLDQMQKEAETANEIGAVWLHFKGQPLEKGYAIIPISHFKELVELAKLGRSLRK